ncbi:hypothetical protein [Deinococcus peraridilitoris]|uniref:hypothetical protein n=1 Tax=Deinococcus peraridilitoris TaxID=432329 RepID=UPI0012FC106E|nr:hypothetical protein [Deinococcus peraridilitoris]
MYHFVSRRLTSWLLIGMLACCWLLSVGHALGWLPSGLAFGPVMAWSTGVPLLVWSCWCILVRIRGGWRPEGRSSSPRTRQDVSL